MVREGYKQTEVGVIPEDWKVVLISELTTEVGDGIHATPTYSNNGAYYFVNGNNLLNGKIIVGEETKKADSSEFKKHKKNLGESTILLSINGTIGNLAFYKGEPIILGKSAAYLNVQKEISKHYLYFALQTRSVAEFFEDGLTGTTIRNLGLGTIRKTPIAIPEDNEEQHAIATALSDVDALITALDKLIAKKRYLKTATMQQLLTGKRRLPGFGEGKGYKQTEIGAIPEDWDAVPITKATDEIFLGLTTKVDYVDSGGIPLIRASDIADGKLSFDKARTISMRQHKELTKYRRPKRGDVLVSKSGSLGVCTIVDVDREFSIYESIIVLQVNELLSSSFLLSLIRDEQTQVRMIGEKVGSTVGHLNLEMFRKLVIALPPKEEQCAIATVLSDMDAEIVALEARLAKTQALKQGMMQELLTGNTRLV